jgi:hypothetical protein
MQSIRMPHVPPLLLDHPPVGKWPPPGPPSSGSALLYWWPEDGWQLGRVLRRTSRATWTRCWNLLRTACAGFCCVLLRRALPLEADYRKSSYRSGPAKAGPEQISSEKSRDVTSALVISKGNEIKIDFLSSRFDYFGRRTTTKTSRNGRRTNFQTTKSSIKTGRRFLPTAAIEGLQGQQEKDRMREQKTAP